MVRTQVQLTEEQARRLREASARYGFSQAEAIRQALDFWLPTLEQASRDEQWRRSIASVGQYEDIEGKTDLAEDHDSYLAEIIYEESHPKDGGAIGGTG